MKRVKVRSNSKEKLVSVVIPAYRAEKFIAKSLSEINNVLERIRYNYEIICVVDGTSIDNTYEIAQKVAQMHKGVIRIIGLPKNSGKGNAVKSGMLQARGDIIGFIDAGLDINANSISILLEHFEWYDADIIIGSKRHPASKVEYTWQRKIVSFVYQILVKLLFGLRVRDTQVGLKFFKKEVVKKVAPKLLVKEFAFDIEMLAVANYFGFKRIYEAPIELKMDFSSTIMSKGFARTVFRMLWDTAAVFYRLNILHYYDIKK